MASLNTISVQQLFKLIGTPACPVLIDVRIDEDFHADPCFIPGAYRWPFDRMAELAAELRGKKAIVNCWKGLKLSEGAAALLRLEGIDSEILEGGQVAWREAGYPCVARDKIPVSADGEGSLWVTRHRPKVDRIACPWLIRRFIDPKARFLFVAPAQVEGVADRFGATPFDVEGAFGVTAALSVHSTL